MKTSGFVFISGAVIYTVISLNSFSEGLSNHEQYNFKLNNSKDLLIINTIRTHRWTEQRVMLAGTSTNGYEDKTKDIKHQTLDLIKEKRVQKKDIKTEFLKNGEFIRPVPGIVTSPFGYRDGQPHDGIDMRAHPGQYVRASAKGKVIYSGWIKGYGWIVILNHNNGYITRYAHNSVVVVNAGDVVEQGQVIAAAGDSGKSDGPHLHFEIRKNDIPQNPVNYIN